jgi:hypothetical protein
MKLITLTLYACIVVLSSCHLIDFAKGERDDYSKAFKKNKNYMQMVSFRGRLENKSSISKQKEVEYSLKLNLASIDSVPNLANRKFFSYFSFEDEKSLVIAVNKKIYDNVVVGDSVIKTSNTYKILTKNSKIETIYNWLSEGNEWLDK